MEFSSIQDMLEKAILQKVVQNRKDLTDQGDSLKMTTTWLVDEGIDLIFGHEKLGIPFKDIHVIVNTRFFQPWSRVKNYPDAYHQLSKNAKWESIDAIVRRAETTEVNPIAFISLVSCFRGRGATKRPSLAEVLDHLTYPSTKKRLIIVLSSEDSREKIIAEISDAKRIVTNKFNDVMIDEFNISDEGGKYHGFSASF